MALSGSNTRNLYPDGRVQLRTKWSATQNRTANTSTITVRTYIYFKYDIYAPATKQGHISIGGVRTNYTYTIGNHATSIEKHLGTATRTVAHKTDGTLTVNIATSNRFDITYAGRYIGSGGASFNITLNRIPRNSTLTAASNANIPSGSPSFTIAAADSSFTHSVDLVMAGKKILSRTGLRGGTHNFNLTAVERDRILQLMHNLHESLFTVSLKTFISGSQIGIVQSRSAKFIVDASIKPTITDVTFKDLNHVSKNGDLYVGASRLYIIATSEAVGYASIRSTIITYNHRTTSGSHVQTPVINDASPYNEIVVVVTDTRGRKDTKRVPVDVKEFVRPTINNEFYRCDKNGSPHQDGEYLYQKVSMTNGSDVDGQWNITYRMNGSDEWFKLGSGTDATIEYERVTPRVHLDLNISYEVRACIKNYLYMNDIRYTIPTAYTILDIRANGKGVAIGKVSEMDAFEVDMPAVFHEPIKQNSNEMVMSHSVRLGATTDLDEITEAAIYFNPDGEEVKKMANAPTEQPFSLIVTTHSGCSQLLIESEEEVNKEYHGGQIWQRNQSDEWEPWRLLVPRSMKKNDVLYGIYPENQGMIRSGFLSQISTTIYFSFKSDKPLDEVKSVKLTKFKANIRGITGAYLGTPRYILGGYDYLSDSNYTAETNVVDRYTISIHLIRKSKFTEVTNNTPVSISVEEIEFEFK